MPNIGDKKSWFLKFFSKKNLEFFSNRERTTILFYLTLKLLWLKIDLRLKKYNDKKDVVITEDPRYVKIFFILFTNIVIFYIQIC